MELDNLIWVLILLSPLLGRLFGKKKQPAKKRIPAERKPLPPPPEVAPAPHPVRQRAESPFEEALRQIQEALAEGREEPEPAPEHVVLRQPVETESRRQAETGPPTERPRTPLKRPDKERMPARKEVAPTYDDAFEALPSEFAADGPRSIGETESEVSQHSIVAQEIPGTTRIDSPSFVVHFGEGGTSFKEAFVYGQIFGPPRSRNPWRSPD